MALITCGSRHTIAIKNSFKVFGWGEAEYGALGMRLSNSWEPIQVIVGDTS